MLQVHGKINWKMPLIYWKVITQTNWKMTLIHQKIIVQVHWKIMKIMCWDCWIQTHQRHLQGINCNINSFNFSDIIVLFYFILFRSSELEYNHQNQESRVKSIKEFLDSIYQDITNNNQLLLAMESFQKGYEKAKNTSDGQLVSYLHQNYQKLDSRFSVKNRKNSCTSRFNSKA